MIIKLTDVFFNTDKLDSAYCEKLEEWDNDSRKYIQSGSRFRLNIGGKIYYIYGVTPKEFAEVLEYASNYHSKSLFFDADKWLEEWAEYKTPTSVGEESPDAHKRTTCT